MKTSRKLKVVSLQSSLLRQGYERQAVFSRRYNRHSVPGFFRRLLLLIAGLGLISFPFNTALAVSQSDFQKKKDYYNNQAEQAQQQAELKQKQAQEFSNQINLLNNNISKIENSIVSTGNQITDTEANITKLEADIKKSEDDLRIEEAKMDQVISAWYMQGNSGLLEAIIGSNNISEVVDQQEQYDSIKQQVNASIDKLEADRKKLTEQKNDQQGKKNKLDELLNQQQSYKSASVSEKKRKDSMLNMTLVQKQQYLDMAAKAKQEVLRISAEEAEWRRQQDAKSKVKISTGGSGGYPYDDSEAIDPWGFYQLQCTSYAAWYWNEVLGKDWLRGEGPVGTGDAKNWATLARNQGYTVSTTPKEKAIVSWESGPHGHVAIVQKVNGDGSIDVSEYNWIAYSYSYRSNVQPAVYGSYVYIY